MSRVNRKVNKTLVGTTVDVDVTDMVAPLTITLNSVAPGRAIEISTNQSGESFFNPGYETSHPNQLISAITIDIARVRFTGAANDTWSIL
jgi:hypothetical protein